MLADYLNGFVNPFKKREEYYTFTFHQDELMAFCHQTDASVASFASVLLFKAMDRVLPKRHQYIRATMAHNPCAALGIPDAHSHMLSHMQIDYKRELASSDMAKLGTLTRGQMMLQEDPSVSSVELRHNLKMIAAIDGAQGLKQKRKEAKRMNISLGKGAVHGTYNINYTGYADWGELASYVDSYVLIVDGHIVIEVSSCGDKIVIAMMTLVKSAKYINAIEEVLQQLGITYSLEGPFQKNLPYHEYPR